MEPSNPTAKLNDTPCTQSTESCESSCHHTPKKKRTEFKKRVNHYLYDNLNRVLCELYFYCEHESNAIQCSEVLNILCQASLQFHQLNRQLILLSNANIKNTKSISWNVSALSPQRLDFNKFNQNTFKSQNIANIKNLSKDITNIPIIPNTILPQNIAVNTVNIKGNVSVISDETKQSETQTNNVSITDRDDSKQTEITQKIDDTPKPKPAKTTKPKTETPKTPPTKPVIKSWADYDSESDLDFSVKSESECEEDSHHNGYEKYIKCDIPKCENKKILKTKHENDSKSEDTKEEIIISEIIIEPTQNQKIEISPKKIEKENIEIISEPIQTEKLSEKCEEILSEQKSEEPQSSIIYQNKHKKWRQKSVQKSEEKIEKSEEMMDILKENVNILNAEVSVWCEGECEQITLKDIMNDQSQNLLNKIENNKDKSKKNGSQSQHTFPLPFNKLVANNNPHRHTQKSLFIGAPQDLNKHKIFRNNKKIDKLIDKLFNKSHANINRTEQIQKTQLKQEKAEKRRLQLRAQQTNKWQIVAAKKKQKREKLRQETQHKLMLQKLELNKKLSSAQIRYETQIKEKKLKAKQYDIKVKNAKKNKDFQLSKKREIQRSKHELKMQNAQKRYKEKISKKKEIAAITSQKKKKEIAVINISNSNPNSNKSTNKKKHKNGNGNKLKKSKNNNSKSKSQTPRKKDRQNNTDFFTHFGREMQMSEEKINISESEVRKTLNILLKQSKEYISKIKLTKNQWIGNCHYSELRVAVQSLSNKINRLNIAKRDCVTFLMGLIFAKTKSKNESERNSNISLESSLQNILKLMDNKQITDASNTYLLMYLIDDLIECIPFFNGLSLRTQRLLLQCIVNCAQKNRGIGQYIIRSKSCLYLLHLFYEIMFVQNGSNNGIDVYSIMHTLTISVNAIRDWPDLVQRKIIFYKYLSILKFFNKMVCLFAKIKINNSKNNTNYDLFLRIVPFLQSVTAFNDKQCHLLDDTDLSVIFEIISETNCYGLQSLISALVLNDTDLNKNSNTLALQGWKKKKPICILRIILYSFQTINNIARIVSVHKFHSITDETFNISEIHLVLSYLLQHLIFHYSKSNNSNNQSYHNTIRVLLAQVILFIGFCSFKNAKFQQCLIWGDKFENNLIYKLCQLPFEYFTKVKERKILFPTLIACTFENKPNCQVLNTVLNKKHLIQFILKTYHHKYLKQTKTVNQSINCRKDSIFQNNNNKMYELENRVPINMWASAIEFYRESH